MSDPFPITIYHNPNCGTSRGALAAIEAAGHAPEVIEYLETGWTHAQLTGLLAAMANGHGPSCAPRSRSRPSSGSWATT